MAAGSIIVEMLLNTGTFETDTKRAGQNLRRLQKDAEAVGRAIGVAFAAAAVATLAFAKSQINQLDALNDLSDATGSTVENLSALEDVARRNGQSLDDVTGILVKFNAALKETDGKNGISLALKAIGLDARALQQLDPAEALRQTAVALAGFADDGNKARIVQELFGKSVREAGPFLKDLAEQGKLNATVTTEQAKAAEEFNKQIFGLQKNVADAARAILGDLIPALNTLANDLKNGGIFEVLTNLDRAFGLTAATGSLLLIDNLTKVNDKIATTQASIAKLQKAEPGNIYAEKGLADLEKNLAGLRGEAAAIEKQMIRTDAALNPGRGIYSNEERNKPRLGPLPGTPGAKVTNPFDALIKSAREMLAVAKASTEAEGDLSQAQTARVKIQADLTAGTLKLTKPQKELLFLTLEQADAYQREGELQKRSTQATIDAFSARESFLQQQKAVTDSLLDEVVAARQQATQFGATAAAIEAQAIAKNRAVAASKELLAIAREERDELDPIAAEYRKQAAAIRDAAKAREELIAKQNLLLNDPTAGAEQAVKDYLEAISKAGLATHDAISNALTSLEDLTVEALLGGDIKSAAKSLVNQLISEFYRLQVVRPLLASIFGGGGGGGLAALLKLFGGGQSNLQLGSTTITPQLVGEFATGTPYVPKTGLALVHEGERITPRAQNTAGSGGTVVEVHNYSGATVREESSQRGDKKLTRLIIGEIARDSRSGGVTRQATREAVGPRPRRG